MKKLFSLLSLLLCICMLGACAGTPVIYHNGDCDCPTDQTDAPVPEGALKTGLAILTSTKGSTQGEAKYDVTMVGVLVDDNGVIRDCIIDSIGTSVKFDTSGQLTSDLTVAPATKNELGDNYKMPSGSWKAQAKALAKYVVGKTADEVGGIAINAETRPTSADLSSSVTMTIGSYIPAIQAAVKNAKHLGAMGGDELRLATLPSIKSSTGAAAEKFGNAQLDADVTALTLKDGVITSCVLDSVQAKVEFDATGTIKSDISSPVKTKNELGKDYGMVAWGHAKYEWNEQAASFAKYVTGKTPAAVAGIAVNESTKPTESDLSSSVTIAIGGFKALIQKAAQ